MKKLLKILFLLLAFNVAKAQQPSGFPFKISPPLWYQMPWLKTDSGLIINPRDTNFIPRYAGTIIPRFNGGDTSLWMWSGFAWNKVASNGFFNFAGIGLQSSGTTVFIPNSGVVAGPYGGLSSFLVNTRGIITAGTPGVVLNQGTGITIGSIRQGAGSPGQTQLLLNNLHDTTYISWHKRADSSIYPLLDTAGLRAAFGGGGGGGGNLDATLSLGGSFSADRLSNENLHSWTIDRAKFIYTHPYNGGTITVNPDSTNSGGTVDVLRINSAFAHPNVPYTIRYIPASNGDGTYDQVLMQGFNIDRSFDPTQSSWKTSLEYHYLGSLHEYHLEFQNPAGEVARVMSFTLSEGGSLFTSASNLYFKINHIEMRAHGVGDTAFITFAGDVRTATTFTISARDGLSQVTEAVSGNAVTFTGLSSSTNFNFSTLDKFQVNGITGVVSSNGDATSSASTRSRNNLADDIIMNINGNSAGGIYNRMAEIFSTAPSQVQRISWGGSTYPNIILIGDYGNYTPLTTGNYHAQVIDRFYVAGAEKLNDTLQMPNLIQKSIDTTNLKVLVADASGNTYKMYWPSTGGGGGTPDTLANTRAGDTIFTNPSSHRFLLKADSAVVGAGIKISTNDSLLFFKVDTSLIATQSYVLAHSGGGGGGMAIGGAITSATAGSVLFAGTSGLLSQINNKFFFDSTNTRFELGGNSPVATFQIVGGTLAADGSTNVINVASSFNGSSSADQIALSYSLTSAGSANHEQSGFNLVVNSGYTGSNAVVGIASVNLAAGHGSHPLTGNAAGNFAFQGQAVATTIGSEIGVQGEAGLGNLNEGGEFFAVRTKASSTNIGAVLDAYNSGSGALMVGAQIGLGPGLNLPAASTALWIDNEVGGATPAMIITGLTTAPGAFNVMVHANTSDSTVYQVTQASLTGVPNFANTNLTQTANRSYAGATFNLSMNNMGTVLWNTVGFGLQQSTGPIYTFLNNTSSAKTLQVGYTPTALGNFSKGTAIVIDTNNNIAFGAVSPVSTLPGYSGGGLTLTGGSFMIGSSLFKNVLTVTNGTTSIGAGYCYIVCDATSGNIVINLPAASTVFGANEGIEYTFYRPDATGNTITVNRAGSDLISGATSFTLGAQYETKKLQAISTSAWALN